MKLLRESMWKSGPTIIQATWTAPHGLKNSYLKLMENNDLQFKNTTIRQSVATPG